MLALSWKGVTILLFLVHLPMIKYTYRTMITMITMITVITVITIITMITMITMMADHGAVGAALLGGIVFEMTGRLDQNSSEIAHFLFPGHGILKSGSTVLRNRFRDYEAP